MCNPDAEEQNIQKTKEQEKTNYTFMLHVSKFQISQFYLLFRAFTLALTIGIAMNFYKRAQLRLNSVPFGLVYIGTKLFQFGSILIRFLYVKL